MTPAPGHPRRDRLDQRRGASPGRGRRGRAALDRCASSDGGAGASRPQWESEQGNLAATLLITTPKSAAEAAQATFVAALAVADLLDVFVSPALVGIKWPNDVLLDGVKASGILVESGAHANGDLWLAVGIGVNLTHAPEGTERGATSVAEKLRADLAYVPPSKPPPRSWPRPSLSGGVVGRRWASSRCWTPGPVA